MAIHSSILAWRIPWTEEPGGLHTVHGVTKSQTERLHFPEHNGIIFLRQLICHLHCVSFDLKLSLRGSWPQQLPLGGSAGPGNGFRAEARPAWMDHASSETPTQG